jgi:uridine phosphorylase
MSDQKQSRNAHPGFPTDHLTPAALVVGDPRRVAEAASLLSNAEEIWNRREYRAVCGDFEGMPVTICSHGVGANGAAFIFEHLFNGGVRIAIRAGTCGAMLKGVKAGALMIGTGAIRADGATNHIVPLEYPAIADRHVVLALESAAREPTDRDVHTGLILTSALFFKYPFQPSDREMWAQAGAIAIENECAPLLVLAGIHGAKAGGIFTVDANVLENTNPWDYEPDQAAVVAGKQAMLRVALEALASMARST